MIVSGLKSPKSMAESSQFPCFCRWFAVIAVACANITTPPFELRAAGISDERCPGAVEVFRCEFNGAADPKQVGWPDHWTRERGAGYPRYLEVRIDRAAPPQSTGQSLRMNLDGGAAAAYSPPIAVQAVSFLRASSARCEPKGWNTIGHTCRSRSTMLKTKFWSGRFPAAWARLLLGPNSRSDPVAPASDATDHAIIGLHLEPSDACRSARQRLVRRRVGRPAAAHETRGRSARPFVCRSAAAHGHLHGLRV